MMLLGLLLVSDKKKIKSANDDSEHHKEELNEPDYDEDQDQLEEVQEEETGEIVSTNQVF